MAREARGLKNKLTLRVLKFLHRVTSGEESQTANWITGFTVSHEPEKGTLITVTFVADHEFLEEE